MSIVDSLLPEFDHEMTTTRRLLERVPEDRLDWKPHAKSTTLGGLATHLATLPVWGAMTVNQTELELAGTPPTEPLKSRAELLARFDANVAATRTALAGKSDAEMMVPWTLKRAGQSIFTMPRIGIWRSFVMSHVIHHRGQLSVYLRMQEVALPSISGPSADETPF
jgi:uncharacterized damage-inducible protein DinB